MLPITTMKAAILTESGKALVLDNVSLPKALDYGQVLVVIHYTGICGSQIGEIDAIKGPDKFLPHLLGHEASATVLECGPNVSVVRPGQSVVLHWKQGKGIQAVPPKYTWHDKACNAGWITTFNEYAIVSENRCTPIPDSFDKEQAILFGCALTTGLGAITNNARLRLGESVLILGAGGIGLNIVQGAACMSAYPIIAVDVNDARLALAKQLGASHCINTTHENLKDAVTAIVGSSGCDVVLDNTGNTDVMAQGYDLLTHTGRMVLVGVPKAGAKLAIPSLPLHFGRSITGSWGGETNPTEDIPRYMRLVDQGILRLDAFITNRYQFNDINTAIADLRTGKVAGRCCVKVEA